MGRASQPNPRESSVQKTTAALQKAQTNAAQPAPRVTNIYQGAPAPQVPVPRMPRMPEAPEIDPPATQYINEVGQEADAYRRRNSKKKGLRYAAKVGAGSTGGFNAAPVADGSKTKLGQ